jgi:hypothetical protein
VVIPIVDYGYNHNKGGDTNTSLLQSIGQQTVINPDEVGAQDTTEFEVTSSHKRQQIEQMISRDQFPDTTLRHIFPDRQDESRIQIAHRIMEENIKDLSDQDLEIYLTEFQYLIDSWLDEYEKQVFDNRTLQQVLREN